MTNAEQQNASHKKSNNETKNNEQLDINRMKCGEGSVPTKTNSLLGTITVS
jgi:hypothetical protein